MNEKPIINYRIIYIIVSIVFIMNTLLLISNIRINNVSRLETKESGNVNYSVFYKKNNYYGDNAIPSNQKYIASLIDKINVNFNYNMLFKDNVNFDTNYHIDAVIKILDNVTDEKTVYQKTEKMKYNKLNKNNNQNLIINENIEVDYLKYKKFVEDLKRDYHIAAQGYLELNLYIDTNYKYRNFNSDKKDNNVLSITIPLTINPVDISTTTSGIDNFKYIEEKQDFKILDYKLLIINIIIYIVLVVIIIITLINNNIIVKRNKYEKKLSKILKEYDRVIVDTVNTFNFDNYNIIDVVSFEELLDVRESIDAPIIHIVFSDKKNVFILKKDSDIYRYTLEELDIL